METPVPVISDEEQDKAAAEDTNPDAPRARDAGITRQVLLRAARRRFALHGYASTTVREIAADAGVNVALINRYFASKEGLFEACLTRAAEELGRPLSVTLSQVVDSVILNLAPPAGDDQPVQLLLLLLLRSSGDTQAELIRRNTLRLFSERIATVAGWPTTSGRNSGPKNEHGDGRGDDDDGLLLRAQIAMCTGLGMAMLRSTSALEPLTSATADELTTPLMDVFTALLQRDDPPPSR